MSTRHINYRKLSEIFTDTLHHETVAKIIRDYSTNKIDIRNIALEGLQLQDCKTALDFGCGFGYFTRALKDRINPECKILGIDLCPENEASYLESTRIANLNGEFSGTDEKVILTIPTDTVDLVICSYALYFFPAIISEISRVLKPSGVFISITHSKTHLTEVLSFIRDVFEELGIQKPESLPCQSLLDNFNDINGYQLLSPWFSNIEEKNYNNSLHFEISDSEDLKKYFNFKQGHFIEDNFDYKDKVFNEMMNRISVLFQQGRTFKITKNDTVFICKEPLYIN